MGNLKGDHVVCKYHWLEVEDRGLTFRIRGAPATVFAQDMEIRDGQHQNILRRPERKLPELKIDSRGDYARRIVEPELAWQVRGATIWTHQFISG
jgi:hypothetical protein